jgi:hypothetical protein
MLWENSWVCSIRKIRVRRSEHVLSRRSTEAMRVSLHVPNCDVSNKCPKCFHSKMEENIMCYKKTA